MFDLFVNSNLRQEVFNIGGGPENTLSMLELLDILEELTGKRPKISFDEWCPSDQKVYVSNIIKAGVKLVWKPEINPEEGVRRLVKWVTENENILW